MGISHHWPSGQRIFGTHWPNFTVPIYHVYYYTLPYIFGLLG